MKKLMFVMVCVIGFVFSFSPESYAMTASNAVTKQTDVKEELTRADKIEKIFRWANGKVQYRRWNATQGYWVDDDWIDL